MPAGDPKRQSASPRVAPGEANFGDDEIKNAPGTSRRVGRDYLSHPGRKVKRFRARLPKGSRCDPGR
jgi:hypothetical protein